MIKQNQFNQPAYFTNDNGKTRAYLHSFYFSNIHEAYRVNLRYPTGIVNISIDSFNKNYKPINNYLPEGTLLEVLITKSTKPTLRYADGNGNITAYKGTPGRLSLASCYSYKVISKI